MEHQGDGWRSRKLWVVLGTGLTLLGAGTVALWHGKIDGAQWISLSKWVGMLTSGGYLSANVLEKMTGLATLLKK